MTSEAAILRELPDDESMQRVASGDPEALAVLFDRHQARVYRFLRHLVGEEALAEDLLGETRPLNSRGGLDTLRVNRLSRRG